MKDKVDGFLERFKIKGLTDHILQAITFFTESFAEAYDRISRPLRAPFSATR